jgi:hypothetical protein
MSKVPRVLTRKRSRNALLIRLSSSDETIEIWLWIQVKGLRHNVT